MTDRFSYVGSANNRKITGYVPANVPWSFAFLTLLVLFHSSARAAQEETLDKDIYYTAVEYCRGTVPRPMALSSDRLILCYDGWIDKDIDLSPARDLKDHGLFVVRSFGGDTETAIALSDLLRDRAATVVVYDFCVSACADYFVVASSQTYVLKGSLVAWRVSIIGPRDCISFEVPRDLGPKKISSFRADMIPSAIPTSGMMFLPRSSGSIKKERLIRCLNRRRTASTSEKF